MLSALNDDSLFTTAGITQTHPTLYGEGSGLLVIYYARMHYTIDMRYQYGYESFRFNLESIRNQININFDHVLSHVACMYHQ